MNWRTRHMMVPALALALVACDDGAEEVDTAVQPDPVSQDSVLDEERYPDTAIVLTPEQQQRFDAMDRQAVSDEADRNMGALAIGPDAGSTAGQAGAMPSNSESMAEGSSRGSGDMQAASGDMAAASMTMPPRSQMHFSWLDRNSDGRLSVAEYAIWAVPANPSVPKPNDARRPWLSTEQINQAGRTFFYFDRDGSTYLSRDEFDAARGSGPA